jgi:type IV pilus assembly protein PilW
MIPSRNPLRGGGPFVQRGVTLVELMVALVLGLVVSGAALALFMTNKQVYTASENLDRLQEASRSGFELMARDVREADGNPCSNEIPIVNGLKNSTTYAWWSNWGDGLHGYTGADAFPLDTPFGTAAPNRVAGTPAIELWTAAPTDSMVTATMGTPSDILTVSNTTGIAANDILVICDPVHGTIFQATKVTATTIEHAASGTPGNSSGNLPPNVYDKNAVISKLRPVRWYIGYNGRTDSAGNKLTSLYRVVLASGASDKPPADEILEGVTGMKLQYHVKSANTYVDTPAAWGDVDAVLIGLNLASRDKVGTDKQTLKRDYQHVVAIRSRAP